MPEIKAEPLTPGPLSLFSPDTTDVPDPHRPIGTPPPSIRRLNSTDLALPARPSRRARPAVSYAEPSLNTKLRRPTDTLVDAVSNRTHDRHSASARPEATAPNEPQNPPSVRVVHIKQEDPNTHHHRATSADVQNPTSNKALKQALTEAASEARRRRSGPSEAIAVLTAKPPPRRQRTPTDDAPARQATASPAAVERDGSPPGQPPHEAADAVTSMAQTSQRGVRARASGRRQTFAARQEVQEQERERQEGEAPAAGGPVEEARGHARAERTERTAARRRSSIAVG